MYKRTAIILFSLILIGIVLPPPSSPAASQDDKARRRVLYLTHSAGYAHQVLSLSEQILAAIGERTGFFEVTATRDCATINAENLKHYDALVFYTSGDLPFSEDQKQAFLNFVKSGKGFAGVHSATHTFRKWPVYGELIGGYLDEHPWNQEVVIKVEDPMHPATKHLAPFFRIKDEIYQFKDFSRNRVHVLLSLDNSSVEVNKEGVKRADKYFALAWTRQYGKGRVFYSALGHDDQVWQDERFQMHLVNGIRWTMGDL